MPDYIFETSWEVCNRVGGIYTVLSTRAGLMQSLLKDQVFFFGPDLKEHSDLTFKEDRRLLRKWREHLANQNNMPAVRIGRWTISGSPIAILVDYSHLRSQKDSLYAWAWEHFGVQSHAAYGDYDDSCLFGYAVGQTMQSLYDFLSTQKDNKLPKSFVAHTNEWQTGFTVFYLRAFCPAIRTLFTTHATGIGRSIAGNGKPLYDYFTGYNGDQMAQELNMVSKHSVEKQAAHYSHCFTTVSDLTARECEQLLDKKPDIVTPNGFDLNIIPTKSDFDHQRKIAQTILKTIYLRFLARTNKQEAEKILESNIQPLFIAISGRQEWKNKGIDIFLHSMERLAEMPADRPIVAFVMVPYLNLPSFTKGNVTVIFLPFYFPITGKEGYGDVSQCTDAYSQDILKGFSYYQLLIGMDITLFPSYYEPWGYTPMESVAYHIPTVTTSLAGYGVWAEHILTNHNQQTFSPVTVIRRTDSNSEDVVKQIVHTIRTFLSLDEDSVKAVRKAAANLSKKSTWEHFYTYYQKAYQIALNK